MVEHIQRQLEALSCNKPKTGKGKTRATPNEGPTPQETAARRAAVGYGYRADTNTTFGVPIFVRTYRLLHEAEAARLDAVFEAILTENQPMKP